MPAHWPSESDYAVQYWLHAFQKDGVFDRVAFMGQLPYLAALILHSFDG